MAAGISFTSDSCAVNVNRQRSVVLGIAAITRPPTKHAARTPLPPFDSSSGYSLSAAGDASKKSKMLMTTAVRAATLNTVGNDASALRDVKTAMAAITDPAAMADVHSIQLELYAP